MGSFLIWGRKIWGTRILKWAHAEKVAPSDRSYCITFRSVLQLRGSTTPKYGPISENVNNSSWKGAHIWSYKYPGSQVFTESA